LLDFFYKLTANDLSTYSIVFKIIFGFILFSLVGLERSYRQQIAGLRTHILIGIGVLLFMIISRYMAVLYPGADGSRIAAQVVSGIGFIAIGAVLKLGFTVKGVTTIASIWSISAVGLAIGAGLYFTALFVTVFIIVTLTVIKWLEDRFVTKNLRTITINAKNKSGITKKVEKVLNLFNVEVRDISTEEDEKNLEMQYFVLIKKRTDLKNLTDSLNEIPGVSKVEIA